MADRLDIIFAALADPTRRRILAMLLEDDMAVTDVAEPFEMSLAAVSKHLGLLSRAGLISQEKRGRVKWCKLEPDALRDASVWMQGFGQFEPVNLDAFERFLDIRITRSKRPIIPDVNYPDPALARAGEATNPHPTSGSGSALRECHQARSACRGPALADRQTPHADH